MTVRPSDVRAGAAARPYVIVTGGAQGIGRAIARRIVEGGAYRLAVVDRSDIDAGASEEGPWPTADILFYRADVSREQDVRRVMSDVSGHGQLYGLINNAGVYPRSTSVSVAYEEWIDVIRVNLGGTFLMSRSAAPFMQQAGRGSIINVTSGRAVRGAPDGSHYSASKGGVISLTRSLALEWAPTIRVNAIMPGVTDTRQPRNSGMSEDELYGLGAGIPMGRIGEPDDLWGAVSFLLGDASGFVTGQTIAVNGGAVML